MISTCVCVVLPPKADLDVFSLGLEVLARAMPMVFAPVYRQGEDAARTKREVCAALGLLDRHYPRCRADAIAAAKDDVPPYKSSPTMRAGRRTVRSRSRAFKDRSPSRFDRA